MHNKSPYLTRAYVEKADQCFHAMLLTSEDCEHYGAAVGLLAVHCVITLKDAIVAAVGGNVRKHEEHRAAVRQLEKLCTTLNLANKNGVAHLDWLLGHKTEIAYSSTAVDPEYARKARMRAERFTSWAYESFKEVLRGEA